MKTVVTFGTFDMLHIGHLRLFERARALGDRLIVGVSTDNFSFAKKGRFPIISYADRSHLVSGLRCVDGVFAEESLERKMVYLKEHKADIIVMGHDWAGKFDFVRDLGIEPIYLPRTEDISTTEMVQRLSDTGTRSAFEKFLHSLLQKRAKLVDYYVFADLFTRILGEHGVEYFAHSGTMLGCVRHRAFIPWDDDIDLMVEERFEEALLALLPVFAKYGIGMTQKRDDGEVGQDDLKEKAVREGGWYQFYIKNPALPTTKLVYLPIDIFIGAREPDGNTIHYKNPSFRSWFPKRYVLASDIYPLQQYDFGPIKLWGMRDWKPYFARSGFDVSVAVIERIHTASEKTLATIKEFTALGMLPTRDPQYIHFREEIDLPDRPLSAYEIAPPA